MFLTGVYSLLSKLKMTILPLRKKQAINLPSGEKLMFMIEDWKIMVSCIIFRSPMSNMRKKPDLKPTAMIGVFRLEAIEVGGSISAVLNSWIYSIVSACQTLIELSRPIVTSAPVIKLCAKSIISS